jgi:thiol-disulfide isomerase/thioredoxin
LEQQNLTSIKRTAWIVLLICIAVGVAGIAFDMWQQFSQRQDVAKIGSPVVLDADLRSVDGQVVHFSDFKGKNVFIYIWAAWCGPCKSHLPEIQAMHDDSTFPASIISVVMHSDENTVQQLISYKRITFPVLFDNEGVLESKFDIDGFPTIVMIDSRGILLYEDHWFPSDIRSLFLTPPNPPGAQTTNQT